MVLGNAKLNADELLTVLTELEATLNSCPLTYEYDEVGAEMLTPSHLIYGCWLLSLPEEVRNDEEESETGFLGRFRYLARLRIHFWNRWRKEYLTDLREHHRGKNEGLNKVSEGEVVLVHEGNGKGVIANGESFGTDHWQGWRGKRCKIEIDHERESYLCQQSPTEAVSNRGM